MKKRSQTANVHQRSPPGLGQAPAGPGPDPEGSGPASGVRERPKRVNNDHAYNVHPPGNGQTDSITITPYNVHPSGAPGGPGGPRGAQGAHGGPGGPRGAHGGPRGPMGGPGGAREGK